MIEINEYIRTNHGCGRVIEREYGEEYSYLDEEDNYEEYSVPDSYKVLLPTNEFLWIYEYDIVDDGIPTKLTEEEELEWLTWEIEH